MDLVVFISELKRRNMILSDAVFALGVGITDILMTYLTFATQGSALARSCPGFSVETSPICVSPFQSAQQLPTLGQCITMEAIQVQTPPKDDDLEMPELSVPPEDFDSDESAGEEEESEPIATPEPWSVEAELVVEETRDDEIVVEDQNEGENGANRNGNEDGESVLSSPPDSDAEPDTSKTGHLDKFHGIYLQMSKSGNPNQLGR
jgi:hypothetical protein